MRVTALFIFLLAQPHLVQCQFVYDLDQSIRVENLEGSALEMPWAGGVNAAQYNTMDLNGDGIQDLVLFDRMANKVLTWLNENNRWRYHPEYETLFPSEITNFVLLRDYNCDGKKDLFTGDLLGIRVYTNTTVAGQNLSWQHFLFTTTAGNKQPVILTYGSNPNAKINLQIQFDDLPALVDADGDGDLDIFNVQYMGHSVEFHRNFSVENGWGCDSLEFRRITDHWGDFRECSCGVIALNGEPCPPSGSRTKHAGGKALLALDANGDQTIDLVFSEAGCTDLFLLENAGTLMEPSITAYSTFPQPIPASYDIFPAAFHEDVNFDGVKDIISAPNIFARESPSTDLRSSNWLFVNDGSETDPVFVFEQNNFLQDQMIDVGDNSVPAFADADGDGDMDLFVSAYSNSDLDDVKSTVYYYENIGTRAEPAFRLVTDDYFSFQPSLYNLKVQFADLNGDGTADLVFTATESNNDGRTDNDPTRAYFVPNAAASGISIEGEPLTQLEFTMLSVENISVVDVDNDGRADILAGRNDGSVEFWRNTGAQPTPSFELAENAFAGLGPEFSRQNTVCIIADLNGDNKRDLAFTDIEGRISIISDYARPTDAPYVTNIVYNTLVRASQPYQLGGVIWPVAISIFGNERPSIVVGNSLGGLYFLRPRGEFSVFPNPIIADHVRIEPDEPATVYIYSSTGQLAGGPLLVEKSSEFNVTPLAPGFYILRFITARGTFTRKVVKR